jgi:hypothetical protein
MERESRVMSKMIPNILTNVEWIVQSVAGVPIEKVRDLIFAFYGEEKEQ